MKRLLSTRYSEFSFNLALFFLRVALGFMMCLNHGVPKLQNYAELKQNFLDPLHIGHQWSLSLAIFAEVFCSMILVLGLFTRLAAIILLIDMVSAVFFYHVAQGQALKSFELPIIFMSGFLALTLVGPGKFSVDGAVGNNFLFCLLNYDVCLLLQPGYECDMQRRTRWMWCTMGTMPNILRWAG